MKKPQLRRVILKLSGRALVDADANISTRMLRHFSSEIKSALDMGVEVAIVIGAGNIIDNAASFADQNKLSRTQADYMGMLGTIINSMALQGRLNADGVGSRIFSAVAMDQVAQIYIRDKANSNMREKHAVILAGGTGNPYFTTDTAAALRASELNVDALLKGTNVPGVYTSDPRTNSDSELLDHATFDDVISKQLAVMDATAFTMCRNQNIPIHVFDIHTAGTLAAVLRGESVGTRIDAGS